VKRLSFERNMWSRDGGHALLKCFWALQWAQRGK